MVGAIDTLKYCIILTQRIVKYIVFQLQGCDMVQMDCVMDHCRSLFNVGYSA